MRKITEYLTADERHDLVDARLHELTGGSLAQLVVLRDPNGGADLGTRAEMAYLIKLKSSIGAKVYAPSVEVRVAGKPDDQSRRVFARLTSESQKERDGQCIDLATGEELVLFKPIPRIKPEPAKKQPKRKVKEVPHE